MLFCFVLFRWTLQKKPFIAADIHSKVKEAFETLKTKVTKLFREYNEWWESYKSEMEEKTAQEYLTEVKLKEVHDQMNKEVWC